VKNMLKYENVAEIGDTIRGYDFEPMPGRADRYIEGVVVDKGITEMGFGAYTIRVEVDAPANENRRSRVGHELMVPFETGPIGEFDNRVEKI
jgi:hypothetical protein